MGNQPASWPASTRGGVWMLQRHYSLSALFQHRHPFFQSVTAASDNSGSAVDLR
jgi:hypothetical protein